MSFTRDEQQALREFLSGTRQAQNQQERQALREFLSGIPQIQREEEGPHFGADEQPTRAYLKALKRGRQLLEDADCRISKYHLVVIVKTEDGMVTQVIPNGLTLGLVPNDSSWFSVHDSDVFCHTGPGGTTNISVGDASVTITDGRITVSGNVAINGVYITSEGSGGKPVSLVPIASEEHYNLLCLQTLEKIVAARLVCKERERKQQLCQNVQVGVGVALISYLLLGFCWLQVRTKNLR